MELADRIRLLARQKNAIILAHNYQLDEIQDMADHTGDSLELARIAAANRADLIILCGVLFMAESAAILSPDKKVILPEPTAGCPMADMVTAEEVLRLRKENPDAAVVSYINTSAAVKAESDVICTSSNAVKIVERVKADTVIFLPDKNLGSYVRRSTGKKVILGSGFCPTHDRITPDDLARVKEKHPDALVMVHPECRPGVVDMADIVLSTGQMVAFARETTSRTIIVGTEIGLLHRLRAVAPHVEFIPASDSFICPNMKKITPERLFEALRDEQSVITVERDTAARARRALDRMLELSG
jgi:quinolinate synthase